MVSRRQEIPRDLPVGEMLKKINSLLTQSSIATPKNLPHPEITIPDVKLLTDDATDNGPIAGPASVLARSANTIKIYVSYDSGRYSNLSSYRIIILYSI